jgi:hypothetical protein
MLATAGSARMAALLAARPGQPRRIGFARDIAHTDSAGKTHTLMRWRPTATGGSVGQITFESPGAVGLRLGIVAQRLPAEATLRFYAATSSDTFEVSGRQVLDTLKRNRDAGDTSPAGAIYWSPMVEGSETSLEVELPAGVAPESVRLLVPKLSHLYESPVVKAGTGVPLAIGSSAACEADVNCYQYSAESNATAKISFSDGTGTFLCSGTLLNDRTGSGTPYFLTANHCISKQTEASSVQSFWFYRSTSCNSGVLNPGNRTATPIGATLLYASSTTDTSFLQLKATPPGGTTFAGWTPNPAATGTAVAGVHHPVGDLQKIRLGSLLSYNNCVVTDPSGSFSCTAAAQAGADFMNVQNTTGTTEGGSSGSALFATIGSSRYVVGQLYGGNSSCTNLAGDNFYGRFDIAYNAALHQWLDGGATVSLTVSRTGNGQGTVTSAPTGISCGSTCTAPFAAGSSVTLTAAPLAGSTFAGWTGACSGTGSCVVSMSSAQSVVATFTVPVMTLGAALDNTALTWTSGGAAPFFAQTAFSNFGGSAVQSGRVGNSQSSSLATSVTGPGVLTFDWKVSSEQGFDIFSVQLDGVRQQFWSGQTSWFTSTIRIPAGTHTVQWLYAKDSALSSGQDAGWVDHVIYVSDSDRTRLFNWAQAAYPDYFKGTFTTNVYQNYTYRYYAATGNYLGVSDDGRVVVHNGITWNFLDVGPLSDYLVTAAKAGF